jgi:hypothetical protein
MCEKHWERVPNEMRLAIRQAKHDRTSLQWVLAVQAALDHLRDEDAIEMEQNAFLSWWGE